MEKILRGIAEVICLINNILIHETSFKEHKERLEEVLRRLVDTDITLNKNKCVICTTEISFLGHILQQNKILPDSSRIEIINQMEVPTNVVEFKKLLG